MTDTDETPGEQKQRVNVGVGMPAYLHLEAFGEVLRDAFPEGTPYLVGSSLFGRDWRDVDVRLLMRDEDFERTIGPIVHPAYRNRRWNALCVAFSALGSSMTGLPIDFQIQPLTDANTRYPRARSALGAVTRIGTPNNEETEHDMA